MAVDPYSSHVPVLAACAVHSQGEVIELGVGFYSTPLLHAICGAKGQKVLSIDTQADWMSRFAVYYGGSWHQFRCEEAPEELPDSCARPWGLAFVDAGVQGRTPWIKMLAQHARLIVVHDTQAPNEVYGYEPTLSEFRYRYDWNGQVLRFGEGLIPWTTVVSAFDSLSWLQDIFGPSTVQETFEGIETSEKLERFKRAQSNS